MKSLLPMLLAVLIASSVTCAGFARHAKQDRQSAGQTQSTVATGSGTSSSTAAPSTDNTAQPSDDTASPPADKSLDSFLSQPVDALRQQAEKSKKDAMLEGQAEIDAATAAGKQNNQPVSGFEALSPKSAPTVLQGNAQISGLRGQAGDQSDPDLGDQELAVAWDRWRNRFLRFIQMQVQASVNHPDPYNGYSRRRFDPMTGMPMPRFPLGTEAWFDCEVTNDRRIARVKVTQSSGFPDYDRAIVEGIRALDGSSILQFPSASRRTSVRQEAGIRTATTSNFSNFNFGDIERYNVPRRY